MIVLLTGAPGAGKGTQAKLLSEKHGFKAISTGDALRRQVKQGTAVGKVAGEIMNRGELVSDDILLEILNSEIESVGSEKILLDGYPRNISQAQQISSGIGGHHVKAAIHIDVDDGAVVDRISGRRVCGECGSSFHVTNHPPRVEAVCDTCGGALTQRADDTAEKVKVRLDVYRSETEPVLGFYKEKDLYFLVDGNKAPGEVEAQITNIVGGL